MLVSALCSNEAYYAKRICCLFYSGLRVCAYVCKGPQVVKFFLKINSQSPSYYAVINFLTTPTEHVWQASLSLQF